MQVNFNKSFQNVIFTPSAHKKLLQGAEILFNAVKSTMGPSGHNVIIDRENLPPFITKDGVTVAKSINLREKLPSLGAELIKEIASKSNELSGDGSSTSVVLGYSLLKQGVKMTSTGRSAIGIKRGMELACSRIIEWLKANSIEVRDRKDIVSVGTISANGDSQIGNLLADAIEKVGQDGIITIEPAKSVNTTLEVVEGIQIDSGYLAPFFITNQEKLSCELIEPLILVTNRKINTLQEILPVLEKVSNEEKPILVIGDEIEGEALHTLIVNKMQGRLFSCAIKAPSYGENRTDILHDIALITGATVFDNSSGKTLKNLELSDLGQCSKVIVTRTHTTFMTDGKEEVSTRIKERMEKLKAALNSDLGLDDLRKANIKKRLAKLAGGVAIVKVGGSTELEILEKKDRVEDALNATLAAVQEGIVAGGGCALFYASLAVKNDLKEKQNELKLTDDELAGVEVVLETCKVPLQTIVENTGRSAAVVMNELEKSMSNSHWCRCLNDSSSMNQNCDRCKKIGFAKSVRYGYDAHKHVFCDMIDTGIIDPLKVERCSLENAVSVIGLTLTSNCVVINETPKQENDESEEG